MKTLRIIACILCLLCVLRYDFVMEYYKYNTYSNDFSNTELMVNNIAGLTEKGNEAFKIVVIGIISFFTMIVLTIKESRIKQTKTQKQSTDTQKPPQE